MSKVKIVEVGPRDGLQNESVHLDVEARVDLVQRLFDAGVGSVEVGSFVSPKWVPQMNHSYEVMRYFRQKQKIGLIKSNKEILSLVPNIKGMEEALKAEVREIAVFTAASESFSKKNTNATIKESLKRLSEVSIIAKKNKIKIRGYISTCYYCPFEGKINPKKVVKIAEALEELGAYEVSIGDTVGAATPKEVRELNKLLIKSLGRKKLAMHFHDTRGTALANVLASLDAGITVFDSSVGGLGGCPYAPGAAGNVATENLVYMFHGLGLKTGIDLEKMKSIRDWIGPVLGRKLVGANPFQKTQKV